MWFEVFLPWPMLTDATVTVTATFRGRTFRGVMDRVLDLSQVAGICETPPFPGMIVIHKGARLTEGAVLPAASGKARPPAAHDNARSNPGPALSAETRIYR